MKTSKQPEKRKPSVPPVVCPECGMERSDWSNKGKGVVNDEITYCCRGCAEGRECECE
jgi:hypothetical protein